MYVHYTKGYHNSLLTLVTCENILMDIEKSILKESKINLMARDTPEEIKKVHLAYAYNAA